MIYDGMVNKELTGKTALITGASRGIGAATAVCLARNGVSRFILHYNSNKSGMDAVLSDVRRTGAEATAIRANLGRVSGIHEFVGKLMQSAVEPVILVNN